MTHKPNVDELAAIINDLPELQRYREMTDRMRAATDGYMFAMQSVAAISAQLAQAAAALRSAVLEAERILIEERRVVVVASRLTGGELQRALARVLADEPPAELPYATGKRKAQWKDEVNRVRGR